MKKEIVRKRLSVLICLGSSHLFFRSCIGLLFIHTFIFANKTN